MNTDFISDEMLKTAFEKARKIIDLNTLKYIDCFPHKRSDENGVYAKSNTYNESVGFWTGIYMLIYELSGDKRYRFIASKYVEKMYNRLFEADSCLEETGLMYVPSCVSAYRVGKIKKAKTASVMAADILVSVYKKSNGYYYVSNNYIDPGENVRTPMKIATMLNCSILYWATEFTGVESYRNHANSVIDFIACNLIKEDGTVYWEYDLASGATGECKITGENCRGISWALYGLSIKYRQCYDKKIFDIIIRVLKKYVPLMLETDFKHLDSTMLACMVCAIYDISQCADDDFEKHVRFADRVLYHLINVAALEPLGRTDGIIGYSDGFGGFDKVMKNVSAVVGDYFYIEALVRKIETTRVYM